MNLVKLSDKLPDLLCSILVNRSIDSFSVTMYNLKKIFLKVIYNLFAKIVGEKVKIKID